MKYGYLRIIKPEWLGRWSNGINLPCWSKVNIELGWRIYNARLCQVEFWSGWCYNEEPELVQGWWQAPSPQLC